MNNYRGTWDATNNSPALVASTGTEGDYYAVAVAGTTPLNGVRLWNKGDHILFTGSVWTRVDNTGVARGTANSVTRETGHLQVNGNFAVTATTGGGTTGLIPAGVSRVTVTSDDANKQISLPAATVGDKIEILVGTTGCELISSVAADKVNEVVVGATNELALTAEALYLCRYTKSGFWIVTGTTKLGAAQAALVPDAL